MSEEKTKNVLIGATIGAVLFLVILIFVMVYQLISIKVYGDKKAELDKEIAILEKYKEDAENELEAHSQRVWIEIRARELGLKYEFEEEK